ncbi:MAG: formylmethanofuran dehydrogenase subunit E family protein [Planctomycetes bacterium]|nr:formylmethanofuran dehydrogenase subunit E family protein [Planctomycetota bacterium]
MKKVYVSLVLVAVLCAGGMAVVEHSHGFSDHAREPKGSGRSVGGNNPWNEGQAPEDWWGTIKHMHGHVGPWNVLGWRIGQAALREFDTTWGRHELDIICYIPMSTPYSCIADGLVIGTGNSLGRLDIRLAEAMSKDLINIVACRKDGTGPILIFRPNPEYLRRIEKPLLEELEKLSRQCIALKEHELFDIERVEPDRTTKP